MQTMLNETRNNNNDNKWQFRVKFTFDFKNSVSKCIEYHELKCYQSINLNRVYKFAHITVVYYKLYLWALF